MSLLHQIRDVSSMASFVPDFYDVSESILGPSETM